MVKRLSVIIIASLVSLVLVKSNAFSQSQVVPCQLTNADQDTLRLFPERTNYRSEFIRTDETGDKRKIGGETLYRELENRLGDKWDPIWETKDIPYVFYEILKGPDRIGWVFGANQGWPGADNSQLMFAFNLDERIKEFYYQKLPSLEKEKLQTSEFYSQFIGLTLEHFYVHEQLVNLAVKDKDILALDMINAIQNPSQKEHEGFIKTLRGIKKVLVYLDDFKFNNKIKKSEVFEKVKFFAENKDKIPLLSADALKLIRKSFPEASRLVADFVSLKNNIGVIEERLGEKLDNNTEPSGMVYPVYVVYKNLVYQEPFVRGSVLGYVMPLSIDTAQVRFTAVVAVGAQDKEKGKIISVEVNNVEFPQFKGLSLVHFYTKDVLSKTNTIDEKLDKIAPLAGLAVNGKDISGLLIKAVRKGLISIDEFYLHNFFKKDEIMNKIEEYLKNQNK
ncbi:MAG: hypothetical protein V1739_09160 [Candidatus Omnitrophota bacterium]